MQFPARAQAGEACFLLMFSSQRTFNDPQYSHSFASFVRLSWPGNVPCPPAPALEVCTISWLPQKLPLRTFALRPEDGRNYGLHETLSYALASHARVSLWGPFQIDRDLYDRAVREMQLLASGQVQFKVIDSGYCSDRVSNCIHALSSLSEGQRVRLTSPGWGDVGSFAVLCQLRPWIVDTRGIYPWVGSALGLDAYPIIHRAWDNPRSAGMIGPIGGLPGGEKNVQATYGPPLRY
jgi:hypothetical protein